MPWSDTHAISYTALSDYQTCPKRFYHKHIARDYPFEQSDALIWGRAVDKAFENRLGPRREPFPENMKGFEPFAATILEAPIVIVQQGMAVHKNGEARGWGSKDGYIKSKSDILTMNAERTCVFLIDVKTGKAREDPEQLWFQALPIWAWYPGVKQIKGAFFWTQQERLGPTYDLTGSGSHLLPLVKQMADAVDAMFGPPCFPDKFIATPNTPFPCNYCAAPNCPHAEG